MVLEVFYSLNDSMVHFVHKENICEVSVPGPVTCLRPWWQSGLQENLEFSQNYKILSRIESKHDPSFLLPPCWCHRALLRLALQSLGIKWEAATELFHYYLYIIQHIEIRENIDFCQHLPHKLKQPQEFCCFPRWQEKSETSHCAWVCSIVHFNYSCHWKHLILHLLKNQHLHLPNPKFLFPILNQYSWQRQSWLFSIRSDIDLNKMPVWGGAEFREWKSVPDRNYIPSLLHMETCREGGWNSGGIRRMNFVIFYSTESKTLCSCQRHSISSFKTPLPGKKFYIK